MITKKDLLRNIQRYTPEQIANAVIQQEVTLYELITQTKGAFGPMLLRQVEDIINEIQQGKEEQKSVIDNTHQAETDEYNTEENNQLGGEPYEDYEDEDYEDEQPVINNQVNTLSRLFSFKGRIGRIDYFFTMLLLTIVTLIFEQFLLIETDFTVEVKVFIFISLRLITMYISIAQAVKRAHDRGNSGFYILIPFYIFWLIFGKGDNFTNKYGNQPK